MADTTLVEPAPGPTDELNPSSSTDPTPHVEHEAPTADDLSLADLSTNPPADSAAIDDAAVPADDESNPEPQEPAPEAEPLGKSTTVKDKVASTVKSAATKTNGAASGVKKVGIILCFISFRHVLSSSSRRYSVPALSVLASLFRLNRPLLLHRGLQSPLQHL